MAGGTAEEKDGLLKDHHGDKDDATPSEAPRTCTDVPCLALFLVSVAGLVFLFFGGRDAPDGLGPFLCPSGRASSSLSQLTTFADWEGNACGQDGRGPLLMFCNTSGTLDLHHHICVDGCPASAATSTSCPGARGATVQVPDYKSHNFAGIFCVPNDPRALKVVLALVSDSPYMEYPIKLIEALRAWQILLAVALVDVALAYVFLRFVQTFAKPLIYVSLLTFITVPAAAGGYMLYTMQSGGIEGVPSTGDSQYDLGIAGGCFALSFLILCIFCCVAKGINETSHNIEDACQCLAALPTLLVEPFIHKIGRILVCTPYIVLFLMLFSCGKVNTKLDLTVSPSLFNFDDKDKGALVGVVLMALWSVETVTAVSQFAVAYAVEQWYFTQDKADGKPPAGGLCASWCSVARGYAVGLFYHMGTFLYGAFLVSTLRLIRMIIEYMIQTDASGNKVMKCVGRALECCIGCFEKFIEFLNKNAYMDVAMNGNNFCAAAKHAIEVMTRGGNAEATAMIVATVSFLQLVGLGGIACSSAGLAWMTAANVSQFSDPSSEFYVQDPIFLAAAAGVVGFVVAWPFIHLLDIVALSVNYCSCYKKYREAQAAAAAKGGGHGGFCFFCPSVLTRSPKASPEKK